MNESNITLTAAGGEAVTRGSLTPVSGGTYKLAVSGISANNLAVSVALSKSGNGFNPASKQVNVFKALSGTHVLTFKGNGGVLAGGVEEKVENLPWEGPAGTAVTVTADKIPAASREGWEFLRWDNAADGSGGAFTAGTAINTATTLWAIWNPDEAPVEIADPAQPWNGGSQEILIQETGRYRIELWGAQGGPGTKEGGLTVAGGKGGYTKGEINLAAGTRLYVYIGGARTSTSANSATGSYNGGGAGIAESTSNVGAGGGATDVRTVQAPAGADPSDNAASLASRIMVAAGGGGASCDAKTIIVDGAPGSTDGKGWQGGAAGGLEGKSGKGQTAQTGKSTIPTGGKQNTWGTVTRGNNGGRPGSFGKGGAVDVAVSGGARAETAGGGGAGWFGGASGNHDGQNSSGAGGSSYISGKSDCIGTSSTTGFTARTTGDSVEKSKSPTGLFFIADTMSIIDGESSMPKPDGSGNETGHEGPGFARITLLD